MPTSIAEQVRHLGEVLDDFIVDVDADEILRRDNASDDATNGSEPIATQRQNTDSRRRVLLPAAAVVMIIGLVGALWVVNGDREQTPANQPPTVPSATTGVTAPDPEELATIPAENLAANAVLRVGVDTPVGRFEIYDHPDAPQTSLYLRTTESAIGGAFDNTTIEEGLAWSLIGGAHEASQLAFGLAPDSTDHWVEVGGRRIEPDTHGIWYTTVEDTVTSFTIHGPDGPVTIDANPAPMATTTTIDDSAVTPSPNASDPSRQPPAGRALVAYARPVDPGVAETIAGRLRAEGFDVTGIAPITWEQDVSFTFVRSGFEELASTLADTVGVDSTSTEPLAKASPDTLGGTQLDTIDIALVIASDLPRN